MFLVRISFRSCIRNIWYLVLSQPRSLSHKNRVYPLEEKLTSAHTDKYIIRIENEKQKIRGNKADHVPSMSFSTASWSVLPDLAMFLVERPRTNRDLNITTIILLEPATHNHLISLFCPFPL